MQESNSRWCMTGLMRASFPRQGRASLYTQIDLIFLPCVPMVVTLLTWRTGESAGYEGWGGGGCRWSGGGEPVTVRGLLPSLTHCALTHPGTAFPKFGTNFLPAHNFLPGSTKLNMLSCNSTYFPMGWWS